MTGNVSKLLGKHPCGANILLSQILIVSFLTCLDCDKENQQGIHLKFTSTLTLFQNKHERVCVCARPQPAASTLLDAAAGENADY